MDFLFGWVQLGFENAVANKSLLLEPVLFYAVGATILALLLGWGRILYQTVGKTFVLKLPGGGIIGSAPLPEMTLLGFVLMTNPTLNEGMTLLVLGLQFFVVLRFALAILTHALTFIGSMIAYSKRLKFSVECMDGRCKHGAGSGNFFHYWACGGYTLLTALGFAPFILVPVLFGLPDGDLGVVVLALCSTPWPFLVAKLGASRFSDEGQRLIKGSVDILMFGTEWPGWLISSVSLSFFAFRFMWPRVTKTSLH